MSPDPRREELRPQLERLHRAALAAADPDQAVARRLRLDGPRLRVGDRSLFLPEGARLRLLAIGKASLAMSRAGLRIAGARVAAGVIAHPHGLDPAGDWPAGIRLVAAGHPLPDEGSLAAGRAAEETLRGLSPDDVVLVLVSGGGSALCELPLEGVSLDDLRAVTRALQRAGADIQELNTVRRALSRLKGGGLLRLASPARVAALLLSDVMGDDPTAIASGPVVPSPTGPLEALGVLRKFDLESEFARLAGLLAQCATGGAASPSPPAALAIVGSNRMAAEALRAEAELLGFRALVLTEYLQGEAREAGRVIGGMARSLRESGLPCAPPACLILGGETTVTVRGSGRGGRNQELALGAALALDGCPGVAVFSFATDGVDGTSEAAGAVVTGETVARARALAFRPDAVLAANDTGTLFRALGDAWHSGPTGTNVNDLVVVLAYA